MSHFDRLAWLREALASIRSQRFADYEIILVNDAGPNASGAARMAQEFGARYVHRAVNGGVAATRNEGVRAARGSIVAYLDDDDLWRPNHLEGLVGMLDARPGSELAYGDVEVHLLETPNETLPDSAGTQSPDRPTMARGAHSRRVLAVPFNLEDLKRDDFIVPGAMVHRRTLYDRVGPFDESLFVSDDWDWLLRVVKVAGAAVFVRLPEIVTTVRIVAQGGNLSADFGSRRRAALAEIERRHRTPPLEPKTFWEVAGTYAARTTPGNAAPR